MTVKIRRKGFTWLFIVGVFGLLIYGLGLLHQSDRVALDKEGLRVPARIVDEREDRVPVGGRGRQMGWGDPFAWYVTVAYSANGSRHQFGAPVSEDYYRRHPRGSQVVVVIDPQNPDVSRIAEVLEPVSADSEIGTGELLMAIGLFGLVAFIPRRKPG